MVGHFDDQRGGARVRRRRGTCRRWRRSAPAAPTISCAPRSGRWSSTSTRRSPTSTRRSPACRRRSRPTAQDYAAYYERCRRPDSPALRDPNAVVYLVPGRRHDHLRQGQGDGADLGRVLRQRHQRDARRLGVSRVPRAAGAGGLRHRVLAARGGEAAAHAEAEEPRRPHRARHRRRRRHRLGDGRAATSREGACVVLADIDAGALAETRGRPRGAPLGRRGARRSR